MPKVSVIIPVYNTAPCLQRCLDSVRGQDLLEIEIICVNDSSPDNARAILLDYAARDNRIVVIDFWSNRGAAAARNAGMAAARGDYLGFVDSDDVVDADFYDKLYERAKQSGAFIVKGNMRETLEDGRVIWDSNNDWVRLDKLNFQSQWTTAIYKTAFVRQYGIVCPSGVSNNEDVAFQFKTACLSPGIVFVDDTYYHYLRRSGSANIKILPHDKLLSVMNAQKDIASFINTRVMHHDDYINAYIAIIKYCTRVLHRVDLTDDKSGLSIAKTVIELYASCKRKDEFDKAMAIDHRAFLKFLRDGDPAALACFMLEPKLPAPNIIATKLRARLLSS